MPNFYLDIETTGLNPKTDKIISIQFMELDRLTGKPSGELQILKEWELGEKGILEEFSTKSTIKDPYPFAFVPIGYNLGFDHNFLLERSKIHNITPIDILSRPFLDLRMVGILMNGGEFKGSGLDDLINKPHGGKVVPIWYNAKNYSSIEQYVKEESEEFLKFCTWLYTELPMMLTKFKNNNTT